MNNFRKRWDTPQRARTMDGMIGGQGGQRSIMGAPQTRTIRTEGFSRRQTRSTVGNFKRTEGFHATAGTVSSGGGVGQKPVAAESSKQDKKTPESLLHMTLPGGTLSRNRKSVAAKPKKSKWRNVRTWGLRTAGALAGVALLLGGFLALKGYLNLNKVFQGGGNAAALSDQVTPELLNGEGDGRVNVLLLGKGGPGHEGADLTDTILLASVDPVNNAAALVSIPRDFWVSGPGGSTKINAVYANAKQRALASNPGDKAGAEKAGIAAIEKTVSEVFAVPIHYYSMVDFQAFQQAVDTVGGVTMNVPEALVDRSMAWENNYNATLAEAGVQNFDGKKALMYVRSRHGSARGDFDRAERQRLFIAALSGKVLSADTYTNPVKITKLMDTFGDRVSTDFSIGQMVRFMQIGKNIPGDAITSVDLAKPPHVLIQTGMVAGQSVVAPVAGVGDYSQIQSYVRQQLQDGYILKENAQITMLNGTPTSGLAGKKAEELQEYGYKITNIADAPAQDYQQTVLVDVSGGKKPYTKNYLEKRFGVQAVATLPDQSITSTGSDFVIILGSNETAHRQN